jgi:hypothetical protein
MSTADEQAQQPPPRRNVGGRPRKPIDFKLVEVLASKNCTDEEIAAIVGVAESTLKKRARGSLRRGRSQIKLKLRQKQIDVALKGNVTMLIWLGKNVLKQTDRMAHTVSDEDLRSLSDDELAQIAAGKPVLRAV